MKFCGLVAARQDDLRRFYETNQWVLGWMKYYRGRHKLSARALARSPWINAPRALVTPMVY
eukprot:8184873-Pyramimonas_sp.AAC.1